MDSGSVTTPFGRRPMTLGMLASQVRGQKAETASSIDKWKVYRALCEAKPLLDISDRALTVLNALLSFYPHAELSSDRNLIVFPSNAQLSIRCHGMAEQTIRRHMAALVDSGLVIRKDSPNGKRYARKDRQGAISTAYGFSLAPLLSKASEIERLAAKVAAERLYLQTIKERLTLCRRDISKLVSAAIAEQADGDWWAVQAQFHSILNQLPRSPSAHQIASTLAELEAFRVEILKRLEMHLKTQNQSGNDSQNERHLQITESESNLDSERALETGRGELTAVNFISAVNDSTEQQHIAVSAKAIPLPFVLQSCPDAVAYGPSGAIRHWQDLIQASMIISAMLQISPSAYREACGVMGVQNAAIIVACIFQKGETVTSAGGYLRHLTALSRQEKFSVWPMLMALERSRRPEAAPRQPHLNSILPSALSA